MGKALAIKQKQDQNSKANLHKVKKEKLKNPRPRKKSSKLADKEVRVKISTGELQQVIVNIVKPKSKSKVQRKGTAGARADNIIL